jgi:hypothetical protein
MSYQDHLKTCSDCRERERYSQQQPQPTLLKRPQSQPQQKPTVRVKAASSHRRERKLSELAAVIKGVSYSSIAYAGKKKSNANANTRSRTRGASSQLERQFKLKELARLIRGV